jgi:hypothetical protein
MLSSQIFSLQYKTTPFSSKSRFSKKSIPILIASFAKRTFLKMSKMKKGLPNLEKFFLQK